MKIVHILEDFMKHFDCTVIWERRHAGCFKCLVDASAICQRGTSMAA